MCACVRGVYTYTGTLRTLVRCVVYARIADNVGYSGIFRDILGYMEPYVFSEESAETEGRRDAHHLIKTSPAVWSHLNSFTGTLITPFVDRFFRVGGVAAAFVFPRGLATPIKKERESRL